MFSCFCLGIFVWLASLSGCGSSQAYNKKFYVLNTIRKTESNLAKTDCILEVRNLTIDSTFNGKGLVYRLGEFEYESDFYNEYLVSPSAMVTERTRTWLSKAGLCKRVLDPGSQVDPTHLIEGNITELYGDFRDKSSPIAVMEIRLFMLEVTTDIEPVIVFSKTYTSSIDLESQSADDLVGSLDHCLTEILSNLERDLAEKIL